MGYLNISKLCRLCCQYSDSGFDIFVESEVKASLVILINKYLPIKVYEDDMLPKQICETCHVGVATTVDLIDRMVEGQHRLRTLSSQNFKKQIAKKVEYSQLYNDPPVKHNFENNKIPVKRNSELKAPIITEVGELTIAPKLNIIKESGEAVSMVKEEELVIDPEVLSSIDKLAQSQVEIMTPESKKMEYRPSTQVLINIQGSTPDIEMNDLAKGMNVKKIYESHQLCQTMEGILKKRRGRRKNVLQVNNKILSKSNRDSDIEMDNKSSIASGRPKRKSNVPSRYRDSIAENEFEDILTGDIETDVRDINIDIEKHNIEFSEFNFLSNREEKKTHILEDTTVIVTSNHRDEATLTLPAAVNIELDFNEESSTTKDAEGNSTSQIDHTPKASVLTVEDTFKVQFLPPMILPGTKNEGYKAKYSLQTFRRKKFTRRKRMFSCEYCNKTFVHEGRYFYHLKLHNNVTFICEICKEQFQLNSDLKVHQTVTGHSGMGILENEITDENKIFKCGICPERKFFSIVAYKKHQRTMHFGTKPYSCPVCQKTYVSLQNRNLHYNEAHRQEHLSKRSKRYPCEECGKVFVLQSSLTYHIDSHHVGGRKFVCKICGKSFKHKQLLQRHYYVHSEERPHLCSYCNKSFKTKGNLDNHLNLHTNSKVFTCESCGKQFNHLTALTQHRRMHTGEKPFECLHCGKRFVQKGNLMEHQRIHTGEKPYCCQECGKKFTTSSQMKLHEKRHNKDLKFRCSFCPKGFTSQEFWLSHEAKHRGDKINLQCATCQKSFTEKGAYQKHLKSHLLCYGNTYECAVCNKLFSNSSSCIKHMNKHVGSKSDFINAHIEPEPVSIDSSVTRRNTQSSTNPEIVYVFAKKDGNELEDIYFGNNIFTPDPNQTSVENITIGQLPNSFICDATSRSNCQLLVEDENATFEVSIKEVNSQEVILSDGVGMFE